MYIHIIIIIIMCIPQYIEVHHSLLMHIIVHAYGTKHVIAALVICCIHSSVLRMACAS